MFMGMLYAVHSHAQLSAYDLNRPFGWGAQPGFEVTGGAGGEEVVVTTEAEFEAAITKKGSSGLRDVPMMQGGSTLADKKQDVGGDTYFPPPANYYSYEAFDAGLVPTVVGNEQTGAGANLMVEVGKGVTGYANPIATAIARVAGGSPAGTPGKLMRDGRLVILKNGVQYNVQGQILK